MRSGRFLVVLIAAALLWPRPVIAQEDLQAEIAQIKQQLADLEKKLAEKEAADSKVNTGYPGEKVKMDSRMFIGLFDTGDQGTSPNWSADISDVKLRFTFNPSKNVTLVTRLSATSTKATEFDYLYLDYAGALGPANVIRVGQRKIDVGQETWQDNPIENMLISPSISHVTGTGTGIALLGRFADTKTSPLYEIGIVNGTKGVMVRPTNSIPFNIKLGVPLPNNLFASASYFDSGDLKTADKSAIGIAELTDAPTSATEWRRKLWELDLRYGYGVNGIRTLVPVGELPKLMLGATYGAFSDDAVGTDDRDGNYWFVEGLFKLTDRLYTSARYSALDLNGGVLAALGKSSVPVNSYKRTSFGLGYKLNDLTLLKTEYSFNNTSGGASDPSLNQWAVGVASKF